MKTYELNAAGNATTNPSSLRQHLLDGAGGLCQQPASTWQPLLARRGGRSTELTTSMEGRLRQLFNERASATLAADAEVAAACLTYAHLISGVLPPWLGDPLPSINQSLERAMLRFHDFAIVSTINAAELLPAP